MIEKIPYLQDLGITAVEQLPVFQFDWHDCPPGLVNYWGYAPVLFFGTRMPRYTIVRHVVGERGARSYVSKRSSRLPALLAHLVRHALNRGNVLEGPLRERTADAGNPGCQGQVATRERTRSRGRAASGPVQFWLRR